MYIPTRIAKDELKDFMAFSGRVTLNPETLVPKHFAWVVGIASYVAALNTTELIVAVSILLTTESLAREENGYSSEREVHGRSSV